MGGGHHSLLGDEGNNIQNNEHLKKFYVACIS